MRAFARLFDELDASTATSAKVEALKRYFTAAAPADAAWAVYFLAGGKPRQVVPMALLGALAMQRVDQRVDAAVVPAQFVEDPSSHRFGEHGEYVSGHICI